MTLICRRCMQLDCSDLFRIKRPTAERSLCGICHRSQESTRPSTSRRPQTARSASTCSRKDDEFLRLPRSAIPAFRPRWISYLRELEPVTSLERAIRSLRLPSLTLRVFEFRSCPSATRSVRSIRRQSCQAEHTRIRHQFDPVTGSYRVRKDPDRPCALEWGKQSRPTAKLCEHVSLEAY